MAAQRVQLPDVAEEDPVALYMLLLCLCRVQTGHAARQRGVSGLVDVTPLLRVAAFPEHALDAGAACRHR